MSDSTTTLPTTSTNPELAQSDTAASVKTRSWAQVVDRRAPALATATATATANTDSESDNCPRQWTYQRRRRDNNYRQSYERRPRQRREHNQRGSVRTHITPEAMTFCFNEIKIDGLAFNSMLYNESHTSRNGRISRSWRMTYYQLRRANDIIVRKKEDATNEGNSKLSSKKEHKTYADSFTLNGVNYSRHEVYACYEFRQEARKYFQYLVDNSRSSGLQVQNFYDRNQDQGGLRVWFN